MRADIVANGMEAHRKYGAYQLDDEEGTAVIEHMHGRRSVCQSVSLSVTDHIDS